MECELYLNKTFKKSLLCDCPLSTIYDLCIVEARWGEGIEKEREVDEILLFGLLNGWLSFQAYSESYQIEVILDSEDK